LKYTEQVSLRLTFVCLALLSLLNPVQSGWGAVFQDTVRIVVLQGDRRVNDAKAGTDATFVVQVQDANGPVRGARVTFRAPTSGAGGVFANAIPALTVTTDAAGIEQARGFRPNATPGPYEIAVSVENSRATATIMQTNAAPRSGFNKKWLAVIAAVAGAVIVAVLAGGSDEPPETPQNPPPAPTCPPSCVIQPGTPTVTPPG
jgi:hypothetical protein